MHIFSSLELRSKRLTRGQGGAVAQLAAVSAQIRPDLISKPAKRAKTTKLHDDAPHNAMAPSKKVREVRVRSTLLLPTPKLLHTEG